MRTTPREEPRGLGVFVAFQCTEYAKNQAPLWSAAHRHPNIQDALKPPPPQGCNFFAVNYMLTRDALFTVYTKPFRPVHMLPFRPLSGFSRSVFRRTIGLGPAPVNR